MRLKGRTILVLCLLLFGGYALFDHFNDKKKAEVETQSSRLMTVNFEQVQEILIQNKEKILLKRDVDGWRLEEPLQDAADNDAIEDLVRQAYTESIISVVKEGEGIDWKLYGLDEPLGSILFKTTDNNQNEYQISALTNFESNAYARRDGENRVLLVNSIWQTRANRQVAELRDRRFLRHKIAAVDELKVQGAKDLFHLKREDGVWKLSGKPDFKVDQNKVRALLTAISDARAAEILNDPQSAPKLNTLFTMTLTMAEKTWTANVGQATDKKIYAKVTDPDLFLKMEPGALDNFIEIKAEAIQEKPPEAKALKAEELPKKE